MLFSSIPFLYYFLPCVLILYGIAPWRLKNLTLLLTSLFFYGWGGVNFLVLMVIMLIIGYICGLFIERFTFGTAQNTERVDCNARSGKGKWIFGISVAIFVITLVYFKFAPVFPIGISFYTFQIMSYLMDVYRGQVPAQRNFIDFAAYASMFPQLVAGPIVRYADVAKQLKKRTHSFDQTAEGIRRFIFGLSKKVLLANVLGELCDIFRASNDKSQMFYWLYAVAFTLHIYFDFSGYSDMAVGLGKMFGFDFMENFNYPYISKSITEFWRRWHISLGSWFRDYVYIPLGGNRVSKERWFFNIIVVWALTGLWHGAAWNFIVWALIFAVLLVIEKFWLLDWFETIEGDDGPELLDIRAFRHVYVLFVVIISFVIFNAENMGEAWAYIKAMMGFANIPFKSAETVYYFRSYITVLITALIGATPVPMMLVGKAKDTKIGTWIVNIMEPFVLAGLLILITAYLVDGSFNPFLYFRF